MEVAKRALKKGIEVHPLGSHDGPDNPQHEDEGRFRAASRTRLKLRCRSNNKPK